MLIAAHELDVDSGSEPVYCGMDSCVTHEILPILLEQRKQAEPAYSFELALQAPVLEMMLRGMRVDPHAREEGIRSVKEDMSRLEYIMQVLVGAISDDIDVTRRNPKGKLIFPDSDIQLKKLFYEHLGITPIKAYVKGELKFPMDRKVIEQIEEYFQARPIAAAVLAYRDVDKQRQLLETEVDQDWRMRTSYNIGGTVEGRLSSSKSPTGSGGNLQNVSEPLRYIFIADPGYIMCGIDAEQSDSRMIGYMCGLLFDDWSYLDVCESSDLHTSVARMVWTDLPWTGDLKKDRKIADRPFYRHHTYRDASKHLSHGSNFLGKPYTMSKETHIPVPDVKNFTDKYFGAFPCIQKWQAWTAARLQSTQQLTSIHGRKRDFFDRTSADETIRKALAFLAAAPTADNLDLGMWKIWKHMPEVQLLAQVHDAVYFQFPEHMNRSAVVSKAQKLLELPLIAPNGRRFIVPTEAKLGHNWGNFIPADLVKGTPEKNPMGLRKFVAH